MGTNYYWQIEPCKHCGHAVDRIHIGKSSGGWCFALHVGSSMEPDIPRSLESWIQFWQENESKGRIVSEYGDLLSVDEILTKIRDREKRHRTRHSMRDNPNVVRNGEGTWDEIIGIFD